MDILGYYGNGTHCYNIDECSSGLDLCGPGSQCKDNIGSYDCACLDGKFLPICCYQLIQAFLVTVITARTLMNALSNCILVTIKLLVPTS